MLRTSARSSGRSPPGPYVWPHTNSISHDHGHLLATQYLHPRKTLRRQVSQGFHVLMNNSAGCNTKRDTKLKCLHGRGRPCSSELQDDASMLATPNSCKWVARRASTRQLPECGTGRGVSACCRAEPCCSCGILCTVLPCCHGTMARRPAGAGWQLARPCQSADDCMRLTSKIGVDVQVQSSGMAQPERPPGGSSTGRIQGGTNAQAQAMNAGRQCAV